MFLKYNKIGINQEFLRNIFFIFDKTINVFCYDSFHHTEYYYFFYLFIFFCENDKFVRMRKEKNERFVHVRNCKQQVHTYRLKGIPFT